MRGALRGTLVVCCLATAAGGRAEPPLALVHASVIEPTRGVAFDRTVLVVDGRLEAVGAAAEVSLPEDAEVIDLGGRFVTPGLIDGHVHLASAAAATRALHSGITTARSMGTSHFADVGLRELHRAGAIESPEILAAGYHVRPRMAEEFFLDEPGLARRMAGLRGASAFREVAAANLSRRVDWIKTVATERAGLPETDPRKQTMTEEELAAVVQAAAAVGIPVAAHAHGDEGGLAAVRAGVRSIEHGTYLRLSTLRLMRERGTFLVPTVAVVTDVAAPGGDYDDPALQVRGRHMLPRLRETVRRAHALGVPIVAATDTGFRPESTLILQHEIEELTRSGLTNLEALRAATTTAAGLLGIGDRTGALLPGYEADLIVVERNPLENIVALQDVLLVMSDGRIVVDRLTFALTRD